MAGFDSDNWSLGSEPSYHEFENEADVAEAYEQDLLLYEPSGCATPLKASSTSGDAEVVSTSFTSSPSTTSATSPETSSSQSPNPLPIAVAKNGDTRKRLRCKTKVPNVIKNDVEVADYVDGHFILMHPLYKKYFKLPPQVRRLVSKKVSQQKYRMLKQLKDENSLEVYGVNLQVQSDVSDRDLIRELEAVLYSGLAKDHKREDSVRGYALAQLGRTATINADMNGGQSMVRLRNLPSVLLTYIGEYGLIDVHSVDPTSKACEHSASPSEADLLAKFQAMNLDNFLEMLKDHPVVKSMSDELAAVGMKIVETLRTEHWAAAVELCTTSLRKGVCLRVHGHLWVQLKGATIELSQFAIFGDKVPFVNWKTLHFLAGAGHRSQANSWAGAFYTTVAKIGSIWREATLEPWTDFSVRDTWITGLFSAGKLSFEVAKAGYISCVSRAAYNLQQLDVVMAARKKLQMERRMAAVEADIRATLKPWKPVPVVDEWRSQYSECLCRYKFLVLDGDSRFGKTRYALGLNSPGETLYSDCTAGVPMLRDYNPSVHKAILLDELSATAAINLKKLLQASNETVTLGTSPTMMNSYTLHLHRVQIIICSNVWSAGLKKLKKKDRQWLLQNSFYVLVKEPLWIEKKGGTGELSAPDEASGCCRA